MRFEVQYPDGVPHDVELLGSLAVVGRDPSSDLVLHDVKCSRRHAVLEAGADGITIRDAGSANGVYLNGQKVERAALKAGDLLRLGDTVLRVLADEEVQGTVVMGPDDVEPGEATVGEAMQPPPLPPRRPAPAPAPRPAIAGMPPTPQRVAEPGRASAHRPLTLSVLAALWLMSVPMYLLGGIALALSSTGLTAALWSILGVGMALLSAAMAWGLWSLHPWTRVAQMVIAGLGILVCPFTLAALVVLAYMLTPAGMSSFAGPPRGDAVGHHTHEKAFALALLVTVLLGAVVVALALLLPHVASRLS